MKPGDPGYLASLPAIQTQIDDSGKDRTQWAADFAAAFAPESRVVTFDLRTIRMDLDRWKALLFDVESRKDEIEKMASRRAAALLPADVPVTVTATVQITFALAGLADHLVSGTPGRMTIVVDFGRARSRPPPASQRGARGRALTSGGGRDRIQAAWSAYRSVAAGWKPDGDAALGSAAPLARAVVAVGPAALYSFDHNFFPLSRWMRDPMLATVDAFNQQSASLLDPRTGIDKRSELLASLGKTSISRNPALGAGAFLADGIFQALGPKALLEALAGGPPAFLDAYRRAAKKITSLPPLSAALTARLGAR